MADFFAALGLVLVIEGLLYAVAPDLARRIAETARLTPTDSLRVAGVVAVASGVGIVWLVRG